MGTRSMARAGASETDIAIQVVTHFVLHEEGGFTKNCDDPQLHVAAKSVETHV